MKQERMSKVTDYIILIGACLTVLTLLSIMGLVISLIVKESTIGGILSGSLAIGLLLIISGAFIADILENKKK